MAGETKAATPWGPATLVEELRLPQQSGGKRFASLVQLLEDANGELLPGSDLFGFPYVFPKQKRP